MVDPKITEDWLNKADEDLSFARDSLRENLTYYAQICFHFHQAAEKYLKAYIVAKELDFRKIHDLTVLLQICARNDSEFEKLSDSVSELNPFYIETRYPGFATGFIDKTKAEEALRMAEEIASFVKSKLAKRNRNK